MIKELVYSGVIAFVLGFILRSLHLRKKGRDYVRRGLYIKRCSLCYGERYMFELVNGVCDICRSKL